MGRGARGEPVARVAACVRRKLGKCGPRDAVRRGLQGERGARGAGLADRVDDPAVTVKMVGGTLPVGAGVGVGDGAAEAAGSTTTSIIQPPYRLSVGYHVW